MKVFLIIIAWWILDTDPEPDPDPHPSRETVPLKKLLLSSIVYMYNENKGGREYGCCLL